MRVAAIVQASIALLLLCSACGPKERVRWGLPDGGGTEVSTYSAFVTTRGEPPGERADLWVGLGGWSHAKLGVGASAAWAAVRAEGDPPVQRQFEPNPVRHGGWPVPYTAHDIVASGTRYRVVLLDGYTKRVQREQGYWLPAVLQGDSVLVVLIGPGPFEEAVRGAVMRHAEPTHLALVVGAGHQDQAALPGGGWGEMVLDIQSSANIRLDKTLEVVVRGERWRWANDTGWRRMPD